MKPVMQTKWDGGKGNALQACIASLLEQALDSVPNFIDSADYLKSINDFLKEHGWAFLKVELKDGRLIFPCASGILCLIAGESPRGDYRHVILARTAQNGFEPVHDPYPEGGNLAGDPLWAGFILPLDPARNL
ncbi:MAG TPA: hypothetical protein DEA96_17900 [Leptospiraceae bacterium]|nr:hypothetical protein [Spirochaetaceae bacterium]HBS06849.1 hypothetical protein [Leptospiraceae bacterium]|tara:strand:+ start:35064 stop:35462 length:399 start_codon:yes stop_codon:yes gene_type:complete